MHVKPLYLKLAMVVGILFLVYYLGGIVAGDNGLMDLNRKQARLEKIQAENKQIERENQALYRRVNRLKNDPAYLEHVVRQQLHVLGEDQLVFKFKSDN
ncbi:MAG: FtsB family cell division protein [Thermodesulfobacteriota bacterium]